MKKYDTLIKLYDREKMVYTYDLKKDALYVSVGSKTCNMIVKIFNCFGTQKIAIDAVNDLSKETNRAMHYKFIFTEGYEAKCLELNEFNIDIEDNSFFDELSRHIRDNVPYIELLSHNSYCYKNAKAMLKTTDRVAINNATGTGKSFVIGKLLSDNTYKKVLYLSPTKVLQRQQMKVLSKFNIDVEYMTYSYLTQNNIDTKWDIILLDEYHRAGALGYNRHIQALFQDNPTAKKVGLSATPIRYLDKRRDMSNELFHNNVASNLTLIESLTRGILPTPKYISCLCDLNKYRSDIKKLLENDAFSGEEKEILKEKLDKISDSTNGVVKVIKEHVNPNGGKYLVFCKDKKHLDEAMTDISKWFKAAGIEDIDVYSVYSLNTIDANLDEIKKFTSNNKSKGVSLLFSINMLTEGISIGDKIEQISQTSSTSLGVIFYRTTSSPIIFYQQMGRVVRTGNGSKPVIFDLVRNHSSIRYKEFANEYNTAVEKRRNRLKLFNLPDFIDHFEIIDIDKDVIELFLSVEERINDDWYSYYKELIEYKDKNGDLIMRNAREYTPLAGWVSRQRVLYSKGLLDNIKVGLLNKIGFVFDVYEEAWQKRLEEFREYKKSKSNISGGLSQWGAEQRRLYQKGTLSEEKLKLLQEAGFNFKTRNISNMSFDDRVDIIKEFTALHGTSMLRTTLKYNGHLIGRWIANWKAAFKADKLPDDKIKVLTDIGVFKADFIEKVAVDNLTSEKKTREDIWLESLNRYKMLYNKIDRSKAEVKWCCNWRNKQVNAYRNGKLDKIREELLSDIIKLA